MTTAFTIAILTHNRRDTVLLAARTALGETRPPDQVLVLCDGCTDGTADALGGLNSARLAAIELPKGIGYGYALRNRARERAGGDVIVWLADDDLLMPDHLERIGELWDTGRYDLVQSHGVIVHPDERLESFGSDWSLPFNRARLQSVNSNPMSSVSVRVELARAVGGRDGAREQAADWDLWQRMLDAGARSICNPEPTVLQFRASDREQPWPERVNQTTAWFDRLQNAPQALDIRIHLRRARAEQAAAVDQQVDSLQQHAATLAQERDTSRRQLSTPDEHAQALIQKLHAKATELLTARTYATRAEETLERIYDGGWWRLRAVIRR